MRSATRKKTGKDKAYLEWLHTLPCSVSLCAERGVYQQIEAAHVGARGFGQKCPDSEAIPLCAWHHRIGPTSHHRLGKTFWVYHGMDKEALIAELNRRYTEQVA